MKKLIQKSNKALKICKKIKKTNFNYHLIVNGLIMLNLKIEKILFDKKNLTGNPVKISENYLDDFLKLMDDIKILSKFDNKEKVSSNNKHYETFHKNLFQKLWVNFNYKEYKKDRINRYLHRIKINSLRKIIKNKNIVDFGCGHGNFLISMILSGAKSGVGIDYGKKSILFARNIVKKIGLKKKIKFKLKSVYQTNLKSESFDFAIQNGVFHHLKNEDLAYKEVYRVLKPSGYFWVYTVGGSGINDIIFNMSQDILQKIDKDYIVKKINQTGLTTSKKYHLGDGLNAKYRYTTLFELKKRLSKLGFGNFKQIKGGYTTDFDKPFFKDKFFKEKFGSGDLRLLCQKRLK